MTDRQDLALWRVAASPQNVGELTALWLEGVLPCTPEYGEPDEETRPLLPTLARLNRAGFITDDSQPGGRGKGWAQRAYVSGFGSLEVAARIREGILTTRLVPVMFPPGQLDQSSDQWLSIPVTVGDGQELTWLGAVLGPRAMLTVPGWNPEYVRWVQEDAWQIAVFDPSWGRNDLLWRTLETALG